MHSSPLIGCRLYDARYKPNLTKIQAFISTFHAQNKYQSVIIQHFLTLAYFMNSVNFQTLSPNPQQNHDDDILQAWQNFYRHNDIMSDIASFAHHMTPSQWQYHRQKWRELHATKTTDETSLNQWLIGLFNTLFNHDKNGNTPTVLVRGNDEPEYFAPTPKHPARIEFAHGFFASALHEISHWCIAGKKRRQLDDFGYWYQSDGRDAQAQQIFEQVEIKPQAVECLLSLACGRYFYVSQDNLNADFDTSQSTFATDVYQQARLYLTTLQKLPTDAKRLIWCFLHLCQPDEFYQTLP